MVETAAPSANPSTPTSTESTATESQIEQGNNTDTPPDEPWRKAKHKYKANGKEYEVSYDEMIKKLEKSEGADSRLKEAAEREKKAAAEVERLKARMKKAADPSDEDFNDLIDLIGFEKAKKFADKLVWDQIKWEEMTQEQRDLIQARNEADQSKAELKSIKDREAQREREAMAQQSMSIIQKEIQDVLAKAKSEGLPAADIPEIEELIVDEMIAYLETMEEAEKKGHKVPAPPSHEDVLRKIQERYDQRSDVYVKRLSVESLKKLLTKEQLEGLRQAEIDQLYASTPKLSGTKQNQEIDPFDRRQQAPKKDRIMRTDDFFKKMDQRFGG